MILSPQDRSAGIFHPSSSPSPFPHYLTLTYTYTFLLTLFFFLLAPSNLFGTLANTLSSTPSGISASSSSKTRVIISRISASSASENRVPACCALAGLSDSEQEWETHLFDDQFEHDLCRRAQIVDLDEFCLVQTVVGG